MKIQFETAFSSSYLCQPIYTMSGKLLAVELLCRFASSDSKLIMPTELVVNFLSQKQLRDYFVEQLHFAQQYAHWFEDNQIQLNISFEEKLADLVIADLSLRKAMVALPFVNLNINESFSALSSGRQNQRIADLKGHFSLWLDNLGAGGASMVPIFDGLFRGAKLDKHLFWQLVSNENYAVMMPSLLRNISRFCSYVVIDGIDTIEYLDKVISLEAQGVKGVLWQAVEADALDTLLPCPQEFT
jgi:EAL domain-containing protein (putative c-di-GMP-specific phosphodiesterase class I)